MTTPSPGSAARRTDLFDRLAVVGKAFASPKRLELLDLLKTSWWRTHGLPVEVAS